VDLSMVCEENSIPFHQSYNFDYLIVSYFLSRSTWSILDKNIWSPPWVHHGTQIKLFPNHIAYGIYQK